MMKLFFQERKTFPLFVFALVFMILWPSVSRSTNVTDSAIVRPHSAESLSINPSNREITSSMVFAVPFVPKIEQPPASGENAALSTALKKYSHRVNSDDFSAITNFLDRYPNSIWKASILSNLGTLYYRSGYFDKAMDAWEESWNTAKTSRDPAMKGVADWSVAQFAKMNARLGRYQRLKVLFAELKGRQFSGSAAEILLGAREGYQLMMFRPERSFRCGPLAVGNVLAFEHDPRVSNPLIDACKSTIQGVSLVILKKLTDSLGMNFQLAKRSPGADLILPAVVHWKVNHYGALLSKLGDRVELQDPTFGERISITKKALDTEASGYFLVPAGKLPAGWRSVSLAEAASIWGKGASSANDPNRTCGCDKQLAGPDAGGSCTTCIAMPQYSVHGMLVSLHIMDTPLPYKPPVGPALDFTVSYCQRGILPPDNPTNTPYSNLGGQWTFNWLSYIADDPSNTGQAQVYLYVRGGGIRPYVTSGTSGSFVTFSPQASDQSTLIQTSSNSYELDYTDGSKDIFSMATPTSGPGRLVFITKTIDPAGNAVIINYNSNYQVTSIQGAAGTGLNLSYNADSSIAMVTDSNSLVSGATRQVVFYYTNEQGIQELTSITDAVGMQSSFSYGYGGTVITSMNTPYGTTSFTCGDSNTQNLSLDPTLDNTLLSGEQRWMQITDPQGATERVEYWGFNSPGMSDQDPPSTVPTGFSAGNEYLSDRNTFYWSKKAFMDGPSNYANAYLTHWLHTSDLNATSGVVESEKKPLENRVWYAYPGQVIPIATGSSELSGSVARVLVDSSTESQIYSYQYNAAGNPTMVVDPVGRVTTYAYAPNNIDVVGVYKENPSGSGVDPFGVAADEVLLSSSYNSLHEPLAVTNAAGQKTIYSYNPTGQLLTKSVVRSGTTETTTWNYDGNGFLQSITGPISSATTTFTYDSRDRVQTVTDSQGYQKIFSYDALNRLLLTTYPDGSTEQTSYNRRDVEWRKDRLNRWTHYLHDELGRLTYIVDPAGHTTQYQYCPCGALTAIIDGMGNQTSFLLDVQSRVIAKVFPDQSTLYYGYEPTTSRLLSTTDAKQQVTTYSYNVDDTLAGISYSGSSTPAVSYTYDSLYKRVKTMSESVTGLTTFIYNPASVTGTLGGGMLGSIVNTGSTPYTLTYGYDELDHVVSRAIDGGANTERTVYDALERVTSVNDALGTFFYFPYDATNMVDHIIYPNGQVIQNTYYSSGASNERLEAIVNKISVSGTSVISQFGYGYDAAGDITAWQQQTDANSPVIYAYGYDGSSELLSGVKTSSTGQPLDTYAYRYDTAGNRLGEQVNNTVISSAYNNLNEVTSLSGTGLLTISGSLSETGTGVPGTISVASNSVITNSNNIFTIVAPVVTGSNNIPLTATDTSGNQTNKTLVVNVTAGTTIPILQYDAVGNLVNDGIRTYQWDAANRLIGVNEPGGLHTAFNYDGLGRRVQIIETGSSGSVTSTKNLIWDGLVIREERNVSNVVTKLYFGNGVQISGSDYFYTRDHLGSIREVTGTNGAVLARYDYDPYGQQTQLTGTFAADFGFTGHYVHQASGLLLATYRAYSAPLGRWISRDPLGDPAFGLMPTAIDYRNNRRNTRKGFRKMTAGPNLYEYVKNAPTMFRDPMGLQEGGEEVPWWDEVDYSDDEYDPRNSAAGLTNLIDQLADAMENEKKCHENGGDGTWISPLGPNPIPPQPVQPEPVPSQPITTGF